MGRSGIITFKGNAMTLEGNDLAVGSDAPPFTLHYFKDGMHTLSLDDLKGKTFDHQRCSKPRHRDVCNSDQAIQSRLSIVGRQN